MVNRNARRTAPLIACDGPCGESHAASWLTLVGRYAICRADLKAVREFDRLWRQMEYADAAFAKSNREAMADIVREEGELSASARRLRDWMTAAA